METKKQIEHLMDTVSGEGASDLHLGIGRNPIIRVSGSLSQLVKEPIITAMEMQAFLSELLTPINKERFLDTKEIDFSYVSKSGVRFRGNCFFQKGMPSIALRVIPKHVLTLDELHLPPILEAFTEKKQGFFLVVGPVGQGKSTTLAAMVELINQKRLNHIITIEDPIEYVYENKKSIIDQREVRVKTSM
jgi:twitching motility protein PilT